jgi:hypothetical protein
MRAARSSTATGQKEDKIQELLPEARAQRDRVANLAIIATADLQPAVSTICLFLVTSHACLGFLLAFIEEF